MDQAPRTTGQGDRPPETTILLAQAVDGDEQSLQSAVQRLTPLLRAHADYRLGVTLRKQCDPEDLVQEAWLAILPKLPELLRDREQRRTPVVLRYLCQTIVFRIGKLARRHMPGSTATQEQPEMPRSPMSGVVTKALRREQASEVQAGLAALEAKDREVLLLRGIEQRPAAEVAVMLGLGTEAVHKRYQRALGRLRQQLSRSVFDELDD